MESSSSQPLCQSIAITGMGLVSSIGDTVEQFSNSLKLGYSGIKEIKNTDLPINVGALIKDFDFQKAITNTLELPKPLVDRARKAAHRASLAIQVGSVTALQAWNQAQLHTIKVDNGRIGLIIAGQNLNSRYSYDQYKRYHKDLEYLPASYGLNFLDTNLLGVVSEIMEIQGPGFSLGAASASGNVGIIQGCQLIQNDLVDVCLVVGALTDLSPLELQAWKNMGACGWNRFKAEQSCRPFDLDHEGFVYGQGGGCLVLEKFNHAKQRGVSQLASIIGSGLTLDGTRQAKPNLDGEVRAMQQAMTQANIKNEDISYINTHGSSSVIGDETELDAIKKVFKDSFCKVWLNSTKGLIGHCLYAAGVIEAITTVIQMEQGFLHPNKNLENPINPVARFVGSETEFVSILTAVSNSFGFGGINSSLVLGAGQE